MTTPDIQVGYMWDGVEHWCPEPDGWDDCDHWQIHDLQRPYNPDQPCGDNCGCGMCGTGETS